MLMDSTRLPLVALPPMSQSPNIKLAPKTIKLKSVSLSLSGHPVKHIGTSKITIQIKKNKIYRCLGLPESYNN